MILSNRINATYLEAGSYRYRGYLINRGSYQGTPDDRIDGWYIDPGKTNIWDRRGRGYETIREAEAVIETIIKQKMLHVFVGS